MRRAIRQRLSREDKKHRKSPQKAPKRPQATPKTFQEQPKTPQEAPKRTQEVTKRPPKEPPGQLWSHPQGAKVLRTTLPLVDQRITPFWPPEAHFHPKTKEVSSPSINHYSSQSSTKPQYFIIHGQTMYTQQNPKTKQQAPGGGFTLPPRPNPHTVASRSNSVRMMLML